DLDFESGKDAGRIYRIVKDGFKQGKVTIDFPVNSSSSTDNLVKALNSKEEWIRATAHRVLLERKDDSAADGLRHVAENGQLPESRVKALWLLKSFNKLQPATVGKALIDETAGVREQAILVSEDLWAVSPELLPALVKSADDEETRVRF